MIMSERIQARLLRWAALYLFLYSIVLTLSPAGRERTWFVDFRLTHWASYFLWLLMTLIAHAASIKYLGDHDPYLLPAAALLSGWGMLTIWRLDQYFGLRQTAWFCISVLIATLMLHLPRALLILRRFKYLLLSGGLLLTSLTLIFGSNPMGVGPRLWLGCCDVYFQPSEPLKLLLVIYLSAYLADQQIFRPSTVSLLAPTIILTGITLLLLIVQRDLGTASIFIIVYAIILYYVTGKIRVIAGAGVIFAAALSIGYFHIGIIHARLTGWLNPWDDPSGQSYQIIQSLLAISNGGLIGRGPGLGNPLLVPVAISDFIFSAIAEETGLVGIFGLLATLWLFLARGIVASLKATDRFRRFLGIGIVTYLGIQSLMIIGGNLRLFPLTGITLPFLSYGGSSLLTSFLALAILLIVSSTGEREPVPLAHPNRSYSLSLILGVGMAAVAVASTWWTIIRGPDLLTRTDNARRSIADRHVRRGSIVDRNNQPINMTIGESGGLTRVYLYTELAPVVGYTHPIYGQAGLESILDPYLRGLQGNPAALIWWEHLLYGTPPPGLDVRLSIDLDLQRKADQLLGEIQGAILLMNSNTGEILVMASHPSFDPNQLGILGADLPQETSSPLLNRTTQGFYPIGDIMRPLIQSRFGEDQPSNKDLQVFYKIVGIIQNEKYGSVDDVETEGQREMDFYASPQQIASAAAALSNHGRVPSPRISLAVNSPEQGWIALPLENQPKEVFEPKSADTIAESFIIPGQPYWSHFSLVEAGTSTITWLIAGSPPNWGGTPLTLVVTLEESNLHLARSIQSQLLSELVK